MDHEQAFAEEAQEEVLIAENNGRSRNYDVGDDTQDAYHDNETSPLVSPRQRIRPQRETYERARTSYERAIHEPWTGSHGAGEQPWYKRPSVGHSLASESQSRWLI